MTQIEELSNDIDFILYDMNYEGTTLYEAYMSGYFEDEEGYSSYDKLVDQVCSILEREIYVKINTIEEEKTFTKIVSRLIRESLNELQKKLDYDSNSFFNGL